MLRRENRRLKIKRINKLEDCQIKISYSFMETQKSFRYTSYLVIFFNVTFILLTLAFVCFALSRFQFFRLESILFKDNLFKLSLCIKIQTFSNLFSTLLNNYALNIASKTMLRFTSFVLVLSGFTTIIFIAIVTYSYNETYKITIQNEWFLNLDVQAAITQRYTTDKEKEIACIHETSEIIKYTTIFLYLSLVAITLTYIFTKFFVYIKISKEKKLTPKMEVFNKAAMSTASLNKLKVVKM